MSDFLKDKTRELIFLLLRQKGLCLKNRDVVT